MFITARVCTELMRPMGAEAREGVPCVKELGFYPKGLLIPFI